MRMDQGSPATTSGSPSCVAMVESTTAPSSLPPTPQMKGDMNVDTKSSDGNNTPPSKNGIEAIILWNEEGSASSDAMDQSSSCCSSSAALRKARRTGMAFVLEDRTPITDFEEFEVIDEAIQRRLRQVPAQVEPFRIVLPLPATERGTAMDTPFSAEELTSEATEKSKLVDMKCFICGAVLQLPSYAALQKKCHLKCSNCETGETHAKNWMDIILTALYNLEILHQRQYFHCKSEICAFIDHHWSSICPERARTPTWGNTVMSQISTHPELFQSHQRGSGYWALKRSSPGDKSKEEEGEDFRADGKRMAGEIVLGDEDDDTQEYFIEEILSKRVRRSGVEYYVKWEGLADAENSWEKARDIECPELIQDFESEARKHPLWKEGSGICSKRKREDLEEKKARRMTRKQARIPVSQWCHQCLRHKPVVMCCDGAATGRCRMQYCERCLEKFYDEEIVVLQKAKGDWLCPVCRAICCCATCDPSKTKARKLNKGKRGKEPTVSRIIARCRFEGTNDWEYLVHYKGRAETENCWLRANQTDIPAHLKKRYRNTLKMRVSKRKEKEPPATPEPRPSKTTTPSGRSSRTPKGLRTSDFDISRVVFDDQVHRIVVPEKPEVLTPAWRIVPDMKRQSNGDSIATEKIAGVVPIDDLPAPLRYDDEGSSSEDTSDEAFARRHARYETVLPLLPETKTGRSRKGSMGSRKAGKKNHKGRRDSRRDKAENGGEEEEHQLARLSRDRKTPRTEGVERRRSDSHLMHYGSDDLAFPDVMRVEQEASMDAMDISSASAPQTANSANTPLTAISAT